ncbi:MAG: radical SAM protein [Planctomycetales bacterium]|nr:radical SAM protein [Planctomycetales bacterium]
MDSTDLQPFNRFKILSYYREIQAIERGEMPFPRMVELFPVFACDHRCVGCHSEDLRSEFDGVMPFERFRALADELAGCGVRALELGGGGEPLLHPRAADLLRLLRERGLTFGLITHGARLAGEVAEESLRGGTFVRVALDAATSATYRRIHVLDVFDQVVGNVRALLARRRETGRPCTIGFKFLVSRENLEEIPGAARLAAEVGVDYIQYKALRASPFTLDSAGHARAAALLSEARARADGTTAVRGSVEPARSGLQCFLTPLIPTIATNGDVFLCPFYQHRMDRFRIGNVFRDGGFRALWGTARHRSAIEGIVPEECHVYDCPMHESLKIARAAMLEGRMHLEFI